ncbi:MAG: hypothetical protein LUG64_09050, partial [Clostridiales bacterium]|nr:hypothetical protein [Clostridiales bacterium]
SVTIQIRGGGHHRPIGGNDPYKFVCHILSSFPAPVGALFEILRALLYHFGPGLYTVILTDGTSFLCEFPLSL